MRHRIAATLALSLFAAACARRAPAGRSEVQDLQRSPAEWLREESIRLLRDYIRIDTRPQKGEKAGAEFLQQILSCEGIQTELVCPAPGRCNLLARIPGRRRDNALLLLNHIDVVDAFPQYWQEAPPFEGLIKRGFLYGRGSYDMKSLGLAQALAMRNLKRRGLVPESDILFLAEADEEIGQRWGARWLLDHRPEWFAGVGQVLNEGGTTEVILSRPCRRGTAPSKSRRLPRSRSRLWPRGGRSFPRHPLPRTPMRSRASTCWPTTCFRP